MLPTSSIQIEINDSILHMGTLLQRKCIRPFMFTQQITDRINYCTRWPRLNVSVLVEGIPQPITRKQMFLATSYHIGNVNAIYQ